jgi:simple sugar transport system permease protein
MMLIGAVTSVIGSFLFDSLIVGVLFGLMGSMLVSLIFAFLTVTLHADQTVVGMGLNVFGLGMSTTLSRHFFHGETLPRIPNFQPIEIPLLSEIPILGRALFSQTLPVYIILVIIPIAFFVMYKTNLGLRIRAVGEHPKACDTVGINVQRIRYGTILYSGILAGFAGTFVSLGVASFFTEDMVAGRGFMAVAAVIFGRYNPLGVLGAAMIFGAGEAIVFRVQALGTNIPHQFLLMIPFAITILALCGLVGKTHVPTDMGKPYYKE